MKRIPLHPKLPFLMTPSEKAVYFFICKTSHWRTSYEVSMSTGTCEAIAIRVLNDLAKAGAVEKRKRIWGWRSGQWEYIANVDGQKLAGIIGRSIAMHRVTNVVPLSQKLKKMLGAKRAREAERMMF